MKRKTILIVMCVIVCVVLAGITLWRYCCVPFILGRMNNDFSLPLENGYALHRSPDVNCIGRWGGWPIGNHNQPVPPHVVRLAIHGPVVIGHAVKSSAADSIEGYFVLDTRTGLSNYGLGESEWQKLIKEKYDITDLSLRRTTDVYNDWEESVGSHEVHRELTTRLILGNTDKLVSLANLNANGQKVPTELPDLVDWFAKYSLIPQDDTNVDVKGRTIRDAWGNPIVLVIKEDTLVALGSMGRNGKWDGGSGDDIVLYVEVEKIGVVPTENTIRDKK